MRMQDKVLSKMRNIVRTKNLEWVQDPQYANTGEVRIMDDLKQIIQFGYGFYTGGYGGSYMVLQFYPPGVQVQRTCGFTAKSCLRNDMIYYNKIEGIENMLDWFKNQLSNSSCPVA